MKTVKIASALAAFALVLSLGACGKSSYQQALLEDASGIKVEAENAGSDSSATTEGAITVEEGDVIVISPCMDKGSFHLTITNDADGTVIYDADAEGRIFYTIEAAPGTYTVETSGNNATGWMTVFSQSTEELEAQDAALEETLEEVGAEIEQTEEAAN